MTSQMTVTSNSLFWRQMSRPRMQQDGTENQWKFSILGQLLRWACKSKTTIQLHSFLSPLQLSDFPFTEQSQKAPSKRVNFIGLESYINAERTRGSATALFRLATMFAQIAILIRFDTSVCAHNLLQIFHRSNFSAVCPTSKQTTNNKFTSHHCNPLGLMLITWGSW